MTNQAQTRSLVTQLAMECVPTSANCCGSCGRGSFARLLARPWSLAASALCREGCRNRSQIADRTPCRAVLLQAAQILVVVLLPCNRCPKRLVDFGTGEITGLAGHVDTYRVCLSLGPHQNIFWTRLGKNLDIVYLLLIYP